jgi:photosystem II stability/assembly factor-like uncharacterized protein
LAKASKRVASPLKAKRRTSSVCVVTLCVAALAVAALAALLLLRPQGSRTIATGPTLGEHLHSLVVIGQGSTLLVGTHGASAISTDGGKSLARIGQLDGLDAMESGASASGKTVVIAGHNGAMISHDRGRTWREFGSNLPGTDIHGLALDAQDPSRVIAYVVGLGLFETRDAGGSWRKLTDPPTDPMGTGVVTGRTLLMPAMRGGLLRSTDDGASWSIVAPDVTGTTLASDPRKPARLLLSGAGALFVSDDGGTKWSRHTLPDGVKVVTRGREGILYAAGYAEDEHAMLWRSADGGRTWTAVNPG